MASSTGSHHPGHRVFHGLAWRGLFIRAAGAAAIYPLAVCGFIKCSVGNCGLWSVNLRKGRMTSQFKPVVSEQKLNHRLQRSTLAAVFMLLCTQAHSETCMLQTLPSDANAHKLLDAYLDVAIDTNFCLSLGVTTQRCEPYIERRRTNYFAGLVGAELLAEDILQLAGTQITLTNSEIAEVTGIQGYAVPKSSNDSMLGLIFIDVDEAKRNPELYVNNELSPLNLGPADALTSVLFTFLNEEAEGCVTLNRDDLKGNILISSTWIKSDLPSAEINQCIARAFVGGLGLNADGLVMSAEAGNQSDGDDALFALPSDYKTYLEIHYSRMVEPGMTRSRIENDEGILNALRCR